MRNTSAFNVCNNISLVTFFWNLRMYIMTVSTANYVFVLFFSYKLIKRTYKAQHATEGVSMYFIAVLLVLGNSFFVVVRLYKVAVSVATVYQKLKF